MGEFGLSGLQRLMLGWDSIYARTVGILLDVNLSEREEYSRGDVPAREEFAYFRGILGPFRKAKIDQQKTATTTGQPQKGTKDTSIKNLRPGNHVGPGNEFLFVSFAPFRGYCGI